MSEAKATLKRPPPLPLAEAQARLLALAPLLPIEHRPAAECNGFYTAQPVHSRRNQPAVALSAMDGYAIRAADLPGHWRVIGESAAGHPFAGTVGAGTAVRISTGAALPTGADCVLIQEDANREGDRLHLTGTPPDPPARHIRPQAMDFADHEMLLPAGMRLTPARIALAIAGGHNLLAVRSGPSVAVIDSGDELVPAGQPAGVYGLPASNGSMLAAMVAELPCRVTSTGPVADRLDALVAAFELHRDADIIVTSGGASVGEHDLIRPTLARIGAELEFWRGRDQAGQAAADRAQGWAVDHRLAGQSGIGIRHSLAVPVAAAARDDGRGRTASARIFSPPRRAAWARRRADGVHPRALGR